MAWPGYFASLGVPIIAGRDFNDSDRDSAEPVVIVSQSLAQRIFPDQDAVNRHILWTDPLVRFLELSNRPRPIVGVAADVDDIREFGIRLAVGWRPRHLVLDVLGQGALGTVLGIATGGAFGYGMATLGRAYFHEMHMPGTTIIACSALVLLTAAVVASLVPALRAARVDVIEALRSE